MEMNGQYPNFQILPDFDAFDLLDEDEDEFLSGLDIDSIISLAENKENLANKAPTFIEVDADRKIDFVNQMKNQNTVKKTELCVRQFQRWLLQPPRHDKRNIWDIDPVELDPLIGSFILSIRKADGSDYEPDTLTSYHSGLDRCLRDHNYQTGMVLDKEFSSSRGVLAAKRKELKAKGKGNKPMAAEAITETEEQLLREKDCIGTGSPQGLLNQVWWNNTVLFGLRGGKENHQLKWADVSLHRDEQVREFLQFSERLTKTRTGERSGSDQRAFKPKQYAHLTPETCPVNAYKDV